MPAKVNCAIYSVRLVCVCVKWLCEMALVQNVVKIEKLNICYLLKISELFLGRAIYEK